MADHLVPGASPDEPARPDFTRGREPAPDLPTIVVPEDPDEAQRLVIERVGGAVLQFDNDRREQDERDRLRLKERLEREAEQRRDVVEQKPWFLWPEEFEEPEPPRSVAGLIAHGDEVLIYGPPEAGKTFFNVDLACRYASGEPWRGRPVERGIAVYLAGERQHSVRRRVQGWAIRNGYALSSLPVMVLNRPLNLFMCDPATIMELAEVIDAGRQRWGLPIASMFPDTLHSLSSGSKEDNHSFGILLSNLRNLRDALRCQPEPVIFPTHHTGKDEDRGARGGNSLAGGVSLSMSISVRLGKWRLIEVDKTTDLAEQPHVEPYTIENVTLRHDADGTPVKVGVHVACCIGDVPNPSTEDLKARAKVMHREGKPIRDIAKHLGRGVATIHDWLNPKGKKAAADG